MRGAGGQAVLFVQWYDEPNLRRREELALALDGNLRNEHIAAVVLLHGWPDLAEAAVGAVIERAGIGITDPRHPHLRSAYQGADRLLTRGGASIDLTGLDRHARDAGRAGHEGRLQVADMVALTNAAYVGRKVILANTDILFDASLRYASARR